MQQTHTRIHTDRASSQTECFSLENPFMQLIGSNVNRAGREGDQSGEMASAVVPLAIVASRNIQNYTWTQEFSPSFGIYFHIWSCFFTLPCQMRKTHLFVHTSREHTVQQEANGANLSCDISDRDAHMGILS